MVEVVRMRAGCVSRSRGGGREMGVDGDSGRSMRIEGRSPRGERKEEKEGRPVRSGSRELPLLSSHSQPRHSSISTSRSSYGPKQRTLGRKDGHLPSNRSRLPFLPFVFLPFVFLPFSLFAPFPRNWTKTAETSREDSPMKC